MIPLAQLSLNRLKSDLKQEEGYRQFPYKDNKGILTIAIGRNLESRGITLDEAEYMLNNDINDANDDLTKTLPMYLALDDVRKCVLLNMTFNMGIGEVLKFSGMISALKDHDFAKASQEMLASTWAKEVPNRANYLATLMEDGKFW